MTEQYIFDSEIVEDEVDRPVSVYNLNVCFKEDIDFRLQDCQLNEPDIQDLEQKMNNLIYNSCGFKKGLIKHNKQQKQQSAIDLTDNRTKNEQLSFKKPIQPIQQLSIVSNGDQSSLFSRKETVPKINFVGEMKDSVNQNTTVDFRKSLKLHTHGPFDITKLKDGLSPAVNNQFSSKKQSQFSQRSHESYNSYLELSYNQTQQRPKQNSINNLDKRKERSKIAKTTIKLISNQQNQKLRISQQANSQRTSQLSLLQLEQDGIRGRSQSSVSTPKSILKNPSLQNSQLEIVSRLSFQSRLSFSSLNITCQSPKKQQANSQSPAKKVKFCLTKKQARRENIPC
ncbi:unnamed protein product [Paramecium primaurelia]|uniref:Uncharacterized protein n=1 Tax=Paramecium primaurelia TaxID=5886 RepID=A0A8S1PP55_PARPR|nr:unnamed protein product [Paramecium primaurelia]